MATYNQGGLSPVSVTVGEAVPVYRFLQLQTDGFFDVADDAQGAIQGVSAEEISSADFTAGKTSMPMCLPLGVVKVEAGAAVALGATVASDASGRAITHVSGEGNTIAGYALQAASAAGEIIEVLMQVTQDGAA